MAKGKASRGEAAALGRPREIGERLERALARSTADETELVWLEARRRRLETGDGAAPPAEQHERIVLVRVLDHGRVGSHRTGWAAPGDLDSAVRAAIAQSRGREPLPGLPHLPTDDGPLPAVPRLLDRTLARLDHEGARALLEPLRGRGERAALRWSEARVAVFSSRGLRRGASVTAAELKVACGEGDGAGRASAAARNLARLRPEELFDRARRRHAGGSGKPAPPAPETAVLSAEAVGALCDLVNREALSAAAYHDGTSLLREHLGVQVFDRAFDLRDDATDPAGLPFPFDLEGTPKRPVALIENGTPRTPALDQRQAAVLGLPPTGHAIGGADARAEHLFLRPGDAGEARLLELADGGLWVGWLDQLECFEPTRLQVRAMLRGVRRIRDGALAEPLPDLRWETALLRSFSDLLGVGDEPVSRLGPDGYLGATTAPALAIRIKGDAILDSNRNLSS